MFMRTRCPCQQTCQQHNMCYQSPRQQCLGQQPFHQHFCQQCQLKPQAHVQIMGYHLTLAIDNIVGRCNFIRMHIFVCTGSIGYPLTALTSLYIWFHCGLAVYSTYISSSFNLIWEGESNSMASMQHLSLIYWQASRTRYRGSCFTSNKWAFSHNIISKSALLARLCTY